MKGFYYILNEHTVSILKVEDENRLKMVCGLYKEVRLYGELGWSLKGPKKKGRGARKRNRRPLLGSQ
jgi:hypothetical protein